MQIPSVRVTGQAKALALCLLLPLSTASGFAQAQAPAKISSVKAPEPMRPFSKVGIDVHLGIDGGGFDVATPVAKHFNVRAGADFFSYSASFTEQGADVTAALQLRSGHANLDWFPFKNGLRISPMMNFANNNHVRATALIPGGSSITLNGQNYVSSATDPLHGSGSVDFRKTSPGLTVGWGNIVPRSKKHFSFPVELGFYYVNQPSLKIAFSGTACDPTQPPSVGCESVDSDPGFQANLAAFIAKQDHNLSYASIFPVLTFGVGYKF